MGSSTQTDSPTSVDVLIIGAGFAGLCAGIQLDKNGRSDFLIVDKANGVGGTWWHNRYPGATCDVASHLYCYSFEPNPNWSRLFSPQPEIQAYLEHCADKYALRDRLRLGVTVEALKFHADDARWHVRTDGGTYVARHVINASGGLHKPSYPDLPGRDSYRGEQMHTALWRPEVDIAERRVAVIGSAASAIQVVPVIAKEARHVTVFQRTPNYIAPRRDYAYSPEQKARFARSRWWARLYRYLIFMRGELMLWPIITRPRIRARATRLILEYLKARVRDPALRASLEPEYELGCKRILISDDYYDALGRDNVDVVTTPISHLSESAIHTDDGQAYDADIVVYATGFDLAGHWLSLDVTGPGGVRLKDVWADHAHAYRGVMVAGFPNYYMTTGPNTGVGTTSIVHMIEHAVGYIRRAIDLAGESGLVEVTAEAEARYNQRIEAELGRTVWASGCTSWYKRDDGRIETLYPRHARAWARQMRKLDKGDLRVSA